MQFLNQYYRVSSNRVAPPNPAYSFLNTIRYGFDDAAQTDAMLCLDHAHDLLKPQVISTWMPTGVGSKPGQRTIFAETQVCSYGCLCYCSLSYLQVYRNGDNSITRSQHSHIHRVWLGRIGGQIQRLHWFMHLLQLIENQHWFAIYGKNHKAIDFTG